MKKNVMLAVALAFGATAIGASAQDVSPGLIVKTSVTKNDALQRLIGKGKEARRSVPGVRVAPTCVTPNGYCFVPGFGPCFCCFGPYNCWNGFAS